MPAGYASRFARAARLVVACGACIVTLPGWGAGGFTLGLSLAGSGLAAPSVAARVPPPRLVRIGHEPVSAELIELPEEGAAATFQVEGETLRVPPRELVHWGYLQSARFGTHVLLQDGSCLVAEVLAFSADEVVIESRHWLTARIPRRLVAGIVWQPPLPGAARDRLWRQLLDRASLQDQLLMASGDETTGYVMPTWKPSEQLPYQLEAIPLRPRVDSEAIDIPLSRIVAVRFGHPRVELPKAAWVVGWQDGSWLRVASLQAGSDALQVNTAWGFLLKRTEGDRSAWAGMGYLRSLAAATVYASDSPSVGYRHLPLLAVVQPLQRDHNTWRSRLRWGPGWIEKGLGMYGNSRVAYRVPTGMTTFAADVVIDAQAGQGGSAIFRVYLQSRDGSWGVGAESRLLRGGDPPQSLRVPLGDAVAVALIVDAADYGDVRDAADWLHARFE